MNTFLIADDSPDKMQMLRRLVEREWSGSILTADTTEGAMEIIDNNRISAAFIDY